MTQKTTEITQPVGQELGSGSKQKEFEARRSTKGGVIYPQLFVEERCGS